MLRPANGGKCANAHGARYRAAAENTGQPQAIMGKTRSLGISCIALTSN